MRLLNFVKGILVGVFWYLTEAPQAWWVEITTAQPACTYYFGPFESASTAQAAHAGYVEDLQGEAAKEIAVTIKRCQPKVLTFCMDLEA